jgi:hypothetical protein
VKRTASALVSALSRRAGPGPKRIVRTAKQVPQGDDAQALAKASAKVSSVRALDHQVPQSRITRIRHTYTGYSIGCAAVWAVILVVAQRRLDSQTRNTLRLACSGWWSGWTSATIARVSFPPAKKLRPGTEKRLGIVSIVLIAVGLISVIRLLTTGKRPARSAADASGR